MNGYDLVRALARQLDDPECTGECKTARTDVLGLWWEWRDGWIILHDYRCDRAGWLGTRGGGSACGQEGHR